MKNTYTKISTKATPQSEPIPGKKQIKNAAGGYVFQTEDWRRLQRFLILGSVGGSYYIGERKLTLDNFATLDGLVNKDGLGVINAIVDVVKNDRAIKPDPALFALAYCTSVSDNATRSAALNALSDVCRIPTQLFHFVQYAQQFRGWGRGLRKAVANWYSKENIDSLAYHLVKYQSRDGWSNADLIRLSHPKNPDAHNLFKWVLGQEYNAEELPNIVQAFEKAKVATTEKAIVKLIVENRLPREAIPTQWLNSKEVWEALLTYMPMTAMVRNLGKMTNIGLLDVYTSATKHVVTKLTDEDALHNSHIHPMTILIAHKQYAAGHGDKGKLSWSPVAQIVDATDDAFYLAMKNVEPTNKKLLVAVDESGSMRHVNISGIENMRPFEAAAAMAMIHVHAEPAVEVVAYDTKVHQVSLSKRERLEAIIKKFGNGGGTDCSLPMAYAMGKKERYDAIIEYTDNETWHGGIHVCQHMEAYRRTYGANAKLVVGAMVANDSSLPDPNDTKALELVGFDANAPVAIQQFLTDKF